MWKKIKTLITQDVKNENEVKMYAVIMRLILIIFSVYSIFGVIYSLLKHQYIYMIFSVLLVGFAVAFLTETYRNNTRLATVGTWFMFAVLMIVQTILYGTNTDVYQILYVMIIMIFALDYLEKTTYKILSLIGAIAFRIVLEVCCDKMTPVYGIDHVVDLHWQAMHMTAVTGMVIASIVVATADFSDMRQKLMHTNSRFRDMAGRDPLTGMYNRRAAKEYLEKKISDFDKGNLSALTIVMADIDHFKNVNDTYGHDNGDIVLVTLADVMGTFMRGRGIPSRWGGEEFVLVFTDMNGDNVYQELYNLKKEISKKTFTFNGDEIKVTLTYGVAEYGFGDNVEDVIKSADEKLYIGKEKGRNIVIF